MVETPRYEDLADELDDDDLAEGDYNDHGDPYNRQAVEEEEEDVQEEVAEEVEEGGDVINDAVDVVTDVVDEAADNLDDAADTLDEAVDDAIDGAVDALGDNAVGGKKLKKSIAMCGSDRVNSVCQFCNIAKLNEPQLHFFCKSAWSIVTLFKIVRS